MRDTLGKPSHLVAFGVFVLALGGFFSVLHVGMNEIRGGDRIQHGFGSRAVPETPDYAEALRRGGKAVAASARRFLAETFVGSNPAARTASRPAYGPPAAEEKGFDPLEDFYDKHYSPGRSAAASFGRLASSPGSWAGSGGSVTAGASAPGAAAPAGARPKSGLSLQAAAAALGDKPLFGGPSQKLPVHRPQLQASLPHGRVALSGLERGGEMTGGSLSRGPERGSGGALSGLRGQGSAAGLNGADESASASSAGSYNSKMAGGAAAAAAAGGSAPAASAPAAAGGSSGGGSGSGSGGADTPAADKKDAGTQKNASFDDGDFRRADDEQGKPFLEVVAVEKRNGADQKFISEEDAKAVPEEGHLKPGAAPSEERPRERDFRHDGPRPERPPDPEQFSELSAERKLELKKRVHGFLRRVETRYGVMDDIFYTPCAAGQELCREHGLTEGYLTLETRDSAELHLGLKFIKDRWRRYTVGFTLPGMEGHRRHGGSRSNRPPSDEGGR